MRCSRFIILSLLNASILTAEIGVSIAQNGQVGGCSRVNCVEASMDMMRSQASCFVPLPSCASERLVPTPIKSWRHSMLSRIHCRKPRLSLRMVSTPREQSKLVNAINTAESKRNEMVIWNDELLVWYTREKDAALRNSKSILRRIVETSFHLITRLVALVLLQFWHGVWSILSYAQKVRPNKKVRTDQVSRSSAVLGSSDAAAVAAPAMASEESEVKERETSKAVTTDVPPSSDAVVKLGFSKPASDSEVEMMAEIRQRLKDLPAEEKEDMSVVWLDRLQKPEMGYELLSYVRKARGNLDRCIEMLSKSARWRREFGVEGILDEKDLSIEGFFADMVHEVDWLPMDADIAGERNPILLYRSAAHVPLDIPTERWLRFFVHQCEHARLSHPQKQVAILVDRVGSGRKNQDPTVLRALSPIIADHFPLLIGRVYIAPVNTVLFIIWRLVSLILDEETKSTIQLVQGEAWKEQLVEVVAPSTLPVRLGGRNEVY